MRVGVGEQPDAPTTPSILVLPVRPVSFAVIRRSSRPTPSPSRNAPTGRSPLQWTSREGVPCHRLADTTRVLGRPRPMSTTWSFQAVRPATASIPTSTGAAGRTAWHWRSRLSSWTRRRRGRISDVCAWRRGARRVRGSAGSNMAGTAMVLALVGAAVKDSKERRIRQRALRSWSARAEPACAARSCIRLARLHASGCSADWEQDRAMTAASQARVGVATTLQFAS